MALCGLSSPNAAGFGNFCLAPLSLTFLSTFLSLHPAKRFWDSGRWWESWPGKLRAWDLGVQDQLISNRFVGAGMAGTLPGPLPPASLQVAQGASWRLQDANRSPSGEFPPKRVLGFHPSAGARRWLERVWERRAGSAVAQLSFGFIQPARWQAPLSQRQGNWRKVAKEARGGSGQPLREQVLLRRTTQR